MWRVHGSDNMVSDVPCARSLRVRIGPRSVCFDGREVLGHDQLFVREVQRDGEVKSHV